MPTPIGIRVRAYNVGFGDAILLTVRYPPGERDRHVLIDFGTTKMPTNRGAKSLQQVAEQIREHCEGKLDVVVATHRHADHIAGFAGDPGKVIAGLAPELVVQPWTEQPDLAPDATAPGLPAAPRGRGAARAASAAVARLDDMHAFVGFAMAEVTRLAMSRTAPTTLARLAFLGETNLKNLEAVVALQELGRTRMYAQFGDALPVEDILPGVRVDVLGPPTVAQVAGLGQQARTDRDEFWHLAGSTAAARRASGGATPIFPKAAVADAVPQEARWLVPQIERMDAEELLSIVRSIDNALNNTSLILLFDIAGTLLLFPGDAQIENWRYALSQAPTAPQVRARLAATRLYKVGHHGSLNATPKHLLWQAFVGAHGADDPATPRLVTMLSTLAGKHGSDSRSTEVPRTPLVDELKRNSELFDTRTATSREFWTQWETDV